VAPSFVALCMLVWLSLIRESACWQQQRSVSVDIGSATYRRSNQDREIRHLSSDTSEGVSDTDASCPSRRQATGHLLSLTGAMFVSPFVCEAAEDNMIRPYAPLEALVPAARNRLLLTKCLHLSDELVQKQQAGGNADSLQTHLKRLLPPPSTQKISRNQLTGTSMRAAMNIYTANLRFADSYVLTASKEERRSYIRKYNQLPNVKQVVAADLDLRDLYRNLIETKMDDAQAELYSDKFDAVELHTLLQEVDDTYRQWFALISEQDVKAAEKEALVEVPA